MVSNTIKQIVDLEKNNIQPVILLHDMRETVDLLPQLLKYLIDNRYTLEVLGSDMNPVQLKW